jgi:hypothetical protein
MCTVRQPDSLAKSGIDLQRACVTLPIRLVPLPGIIDTYYPVCSTEDKSTSAKSIDSRPYNVYIECLCMQLWPWVMAVMLPSDLAHLDVFTEKSFTFFFDRSPLPRARQSIMMEAADHSAEDANRRQLYPRSGICTRGTLSSPISTALNTEIYLTWTGNR